MTRRPMGAIGSTSRLRGARGVDATRLLRRCAGLWRACYGSDGLYQGDGDVRSAREVHEQLDIDAVAGDDGDSVERTALLGERDDLRVGGRDESSASGEGLCA